MRENSIARSVFLYLTPIVYWGFYYYVGFSSSITKLPCFVLTFLLLVLYSKELFVKKYQKGSYSKYMKYFVILLLVSMIMAYIFWGQGISLSFRSTSWYFVFLYYFVLLRYKPSGAEIFRLVTVFSIIYVLLWTISLLNAPVPLFASDDELNDSRGVFRIIIRSYDIICLGYFCCLCKLHNKTISPFWIAITALFLIMVILGLTRMIIAATILITFVYLFKRMGIAGKVISTITVIIVMFSFSSVLDYVAERDKSGIVSSMIDVTDSQLADVNEENSNWRIIEYKMGIWEYPRNIVTYVFGSGIPHPESSYGKYEASLVSNKSFNRSDAGYPALLISFGLLGLLLFIALFIKAGRQKTLEDAVPYKLFIIFIAIINIMQDAIGFFGVSIAISLYMLEKDRISQNIISK